MFSQDEIARLNIQRRQQLKIQAQSADRNMGMGFILIFLAMALVIGDGVCILLYPMPYWLFWSIFFVAFALVFVGRNFLQKAGRY